MASSNSSTYNNPYSFYIAQSEVQEVSVKKNDVVEVITDLELNDILAYFNGKQIALSVLRKAGLLPPSMENHYYYIADENGVFSIAYKKKPRAFNITLSTRDEFEKRKSGFLSSITSTLKSASIFISAIIALLLIIVLLSIVKSTKEVLR
jgi:hypothetical protein